VPAILVKPKDLVCKERADNDVKHHYDPYIRSLETALQKKNSTNIRIELGRVKAWIEKYRLWATNWHNKNYVKCYDIYVNINDADKSEMIEPNKAPFFEIYSDLPD
jgi:hypothetical protein